MSPSLFSAKRHSFAAEDPSCKCIKRALEDDFLCPITLDLPIDPVVAEDGRMYEKTEIEKHFKRGNVKSPLTNKPIGVKLLPAPQIKNIIETSIENGFITGDLASKWIEKKNKEDLLNKAEQGQVEAMEVVAFNYHAGMDGFEENDDQAFFWYEKARQAGSVKGTAHVGECLLKGMGVPQNVGKGFLLLGLAAGQGSDLAAQQMGLCLAEGRHDLPIDRKEAAKWLQKALSGTCFVQHLQQYPSGVRIAQLALKKCLIAMQE